jgi:hypothetical protein
MHYILSCHKRHIAVLLFLTYASNHHSGGFLPLAIYLLTLGYTVYILPLAYSKISSFLETLFLSISALIKYLIFLSKNLVL